MVPEPTLSLDSGIFTATSDNIPMKGKFDGIHNIVLTLVFNALAFILTVIPQPNIPSLSRLHLLSVTGFQTCVLPSILLLPLAAPLCPSLHILVCGADTW